MEKAHQENDTRRNTSHGVYLLLPRTTEALLSLSNLSDAVHQIYCGSDAAKPKLSCCLGPSSVVSLATNFSIFTQKSKTATKKSQT